MAQIRSGHRIQQEHAELRRRSPLPLRLIGRRLALSIAAIVLAAAAATAASSAALPPPGANSVPALYQSIFPNQAIVGPTLGDLVTPYTSRAWGVTKVGPHEIEVDFGNGTVAVVVHFNRQGLIDGDSSNDRGLRVYGKPLAIGFGRMAARLKRRGWREGACTRRHGHFAALGTPNQTHTYIVWTAHHVTVAMSTAHSTFARTKADCPGLS